MTEAGKLAEFHHPGSVRILGGEPGQGIIEGEESVVRIADGDVGEFNPFAPAAMFLAAFPTGGIHQDAAHGLGRGREEVPNAIPAKAIGRTDQPEVRLVNESRGLQSLVGRLRRHADGREFPEFVVDERQQIARGLTVTGSGRGEQMGYIEHLPSVTAGAGFGTGKRVQ